MDVPILIGVECQFEDAVHDAAFDGHLGVLELLLTGILPDGIMGHGSIQVTQEILHGCCLIVSCCAALKCCGTAERESVSNTEVSSIISYNHSNANSLIKCTFGKFMLHYDNIVNFQPAAATAANLFCLSI